MRTPRRLIALTLLTLGASAPVAAQGWIVPRPCVPPPMPCRGGVCPEVRPACPTITPIVRTSSDVRVELADRVLRYEISETFLNRGGGVGEADYIFPLPKGAAFQDLKLSINGELVSGETMTAEQARGIYEEIVRRQRDPALVEWLGHGMLRARIFPIGPGEEKRVVVRFQTVAEREGDALRVDYARSHSQRGMMVGPVVGMPAPPARVEPEERGGRADRRESAHAFTLTLDRGERFGTPYSPTHDLRVRERAGRRVIVAEGEGAQVTILLPLRHATEASISMLSHRPTRDRGFALITLTPPTGAHRPTPRDVVFVVDVSGSMSGRKMEQARAAGHQLLESLGPADRFRLIDFSTDVRTFRDDFVPATRANLAAARRYIDDLRAEGSTNISGALEEALRADRDSDRLPVVLFVTDGAPTVGERNPEAIADAAARLRGRMRVFTFGVGADVNAALVERLAVEGRGTAHFVRPEESVERAVSIVASRLTSPVITDVRVRVDGDVRLFQQHPSGAQDIFAGQDLVLLARYEGSGDARLRVDGRTASGPVSWTQEVRFPDRERDNPFVARLWATQRVGWLAAERRRHGGSAEIDGEIRELGLRYGIPTEFSSYLVVEPGMHVSAGAGGRDVARRRDEAAFSGRGVAAAAPQSITITGASAADSAAPAPVPAAAPARDASRASFEAAKAAAEQRAVRSLGEADRLENERASGSLRRAGGRTFTLTNGVWKDTRFRDGIRIVKVKAYSRAYFDLLAALDELAAPFALAGADGTPRVLVAGRAVAIEIAPDGAETLSASELSRVERDW